MAKHQQDIRRLRLAASRATPEQFDARVHLELAADLLEIHDNEGVDLGQWTSARLFVEHLIGHPVEVIVHT